MIEWLIYLGFGYTLKSDNTIQSVIYIQTKTSQKYLKKNKQKNIYK